MRDLPKSRAKKLSHPTMKLLIDRNPKPAAGGVEKRKPNKCLRG